MIREYINWWTQAIGPEGKKTLVFGHELHIRGEGGDEYPIAKSHTYDLHYCPVRLPVDFVQWFGARE